jgi:biopolymer transport protein ExbD
MSRAVIKRRRKKMEAIFSDGFEPEFQVAPMADLLFVLLVFFMSITTTEVLRVDKEIRLPVAPNATDAKEKTSQVVLNVTWQSTARTGTIKIDEVPYQNPGQIAPTLQKRIKANPMTRVLIRADRSVEYGFIAEIMRVCAQNGIGNVTFSVITKEENPGGASVAINTQGGL